jgi:hypothetical protein
MNVQRLSLIVIGLGTCSPSGSDHATPAADASASVDAGTPSNVAIDAGSATCTDLVADGAVVANATLSPRGSAPTPSGGTIPDGTYELTSAVFYGGGKAVLDESSVWRFAGTTLDQASKDSTNGPSQRFRTTFAVAPDAKGRQKLQWSCVCATEGPSCDERAGLFARLYSIEGDTLAYFNDDPADPTVESILVRTFTRRH